MSVKLFSTHHLDWKNIIMSLVFDLSVFINLGAKC